MADIPQLKKVFADGLDIHAMTASEMFGVPVKDMPAETRRRAKAINFGIIYGHPKRSSWPTSSTSRQEAGEYIATYFKGFPVSATTCRTKNFADDHGGDVETVFGRVHYPEINTKNPSMRGFLESAGSPRRSRAPPPTSSAAPWCGCRQRSNPAGLAHTTMLLQVHDELIFEAREAEIATALPLVQKVMEQAPEPIVKFSVPIHVDAKAASNWEAAH